MDITIRAALINNIINTLNTPIKEKNKEFCEHNLHYKQIPLYGFDMIIKFGFMDDNDLLKVSKATGI